MSRTLAVRLLTFALAVATLTATTELAAGVGGGTETMGQHAEAREKPTDLNQDNQLFLSYQVEHNGGVAAGGCGFRGTGPPNAFGTITIAGIPADATVTKAILNWTVLGGPGAPLPVVTFHELSSSPQPLQGTPLGSDTSPCWETLGTVDKIFGFTADVTCLVTKTGNGTYAIEMPDSGDLLTGPSAEGAALIIVYCSPSSPATDIVIYEGLQSQIGGVSVQDVIGFDAGVDVTAAEATFVVSDGQGGTQGWSGWGRVNGVDVIAPLWDGDEGKNCTNATEFFDVDTVSIAGLIATGDTALTSEVQSGSDCLSWSAFALSIPTDTVDPAGCQSPACTTGAPVCDAGGPYVADCNVLPMTVTLDGSASTDREGDPIEFHWTTNCASGQFDDATLKRPVFTLDPALPCPQSCDVTLTVTDSNGNSDSCGTTVTSVDTVPPIIVGAPADVTVQCDAVPPRARVTSTDVCDRAPVLSFIETRSDGRCLDEYNLLRTWTSTDTCRNVTTQLQNLTVVDTSSPTLAGVPVDATVECDAVPSPATVTATDTCDPAPIVNFTEVKIDGPCPGEYTLVRTWTATDRCGNLASDIQTLTVVDTTPPVITPTTDEFACLWPPNHWYVCFELDDLAPTAADNCSEPITFAFAGCETDQPDEAPDPAHPGWNGDGNTRDDCIVSSDARTLCVRSERAGTGPTAQAGRHYGAQIIATDACGNVSDPVTIGEIAVPHDMDQENRPNDCVDTTKAGCRPNQPLPCSR